MAKIKVNILNFHSINSHIEILLEDLSSNDPNPSAYIINRWDAWWPQDQFHAMRPSRLKNYIDKASSTFSFEIDADPAVIAKEWRAFHAAKEGNILTNNCADAAQWFLNRFAGIPNPSAFALPVTANHLAMGIFVPSFVPVGVTLPGRVMDNAKYHIGIRDDVTQTGPSLGLKIAIAVAAVAVAVTIAGIIAAAIFFSGGIMAGVIVGCVIAGLIGSYGLFKGANTHAAKSESAKLYGAAQAKMKVD